MIEYDSKLFDETKTEDKKKKNCARLRVFNPRRYVFSTLNNNYILYSSREQKHATAVSIPPYIKANA